jgi:hypothetical protein
MQVEVLVVVGVLELLVQLVQGVEELVDKLLLMELHQEQLILEEVEVVEQIIVDVEVQAVQEQLL